MTRELTYRVEVIGYTPGQSFILHDPKTGIRQYVPISASMPWPSVIAHQTGEALRHMEWLEKLL